MGKGTATPGIVADSDEDYRLDWEPVEVDFGSWGTFIIALNSLKFNSNGIQTQSATITLKSLPRTESTALAIPEPATLALLTLGFLGFAATGRKQHAGKGLDLNVN